MEEDKLNNTERDYDKEPIVIEDYNYMFLLLDTLYFIPIAILLWVYNPGDVSEGSLHRSIFLMVAILMMPGFISYKKVKEKGKRKIELTNNKIYFKNSKEILEDINIKKITDVNRTFIDYYHKSQDFTGFTKLVVYMLFPIAISINIILLINKIFFHILKDGWQSYKFYDAIIIFEGDKFINILPSTVQEYEEIKKYFKDIKNINISEQKIFYTYTYSYEKINQDGEQ